MPENAPHLTDVAIAYKAFGTDGRPTEVRIVRTFSDDTVTTEHTAGRDQVNAAVQTARNEMTAAGQARG